MLTKSVNMVPVLCAVIRSDFAFMHQAGEQEKQKSYLARCRLPCAVTESMLAKLDSMEGLLLQQQTPTRVEHRRSMLVSAQHHAMLGAVHEHCGVASFS